MKENTPGTRDRLRAAAVELFADRGYDAVSVRDVTRKARANLASVGYHFGSKQQLFAESLADLARTLNERRLAALDALLADGKKPSLRQVLDAFARSLLEASTSGTSEGQRLHRLISRAFAEADEIARKVFRQELQPVAVRFRDAIRAACPGLSAAQAGLGVALFAGSLVHAMRWAVSPPIPDLAPVTSNATPETLLVLLLDFGEAGFLSLARGGTSPQSPKPTRKP